MTKRRRFWAKPRQWWRLGIPIGGLVMLVVGVVGWIGFNWSLEVTSSNEFCTQCHNSPSRWVWDEYKETGHYKSAVGLVPACHDCHIPKAFVPKLWVKATSALSHVSHQLLSPYRDKAEFNENRLRLAKKVWASYQKDDSQSCRNCHNIDHMAASKQSAQAAQYHAVLYEDPHPTCIDCHKGIAHHLPAGW